MKSWLPILVNRLDESPVLALSAVHNLAQAAVFDRDGRHLGGELGSRNLASLAASEARTMHPGECRLLPNPAGLTLECLSCDQKSRQFWKTAQANQEGAWASWLLTMPRLEDDGLKMARHLLSAFGPQTTPQLPPEHRDQWSLLPLKAGLGRLFVFGDDGLALEVAGQAARVGLTVTLLCRGRFEAEAIDEARQIGDFDLLPVSDWKEITQDSLGAEGIIDGVRVLITAPEAQDIQASLSSIRPAYLALSGEAENAGKAPGLFPRPVTIAQKALGLVAEMLT